MGIGGYYSYIVKNHSVIIKKINPVTDKFKNLYFDCNSIIYDAIHTIDFLNISVSESDTIIRAVFNKIDEYIRKINPSKTILIAFDGVAPRAKLEQQRTRRYKSSYQSKLEMSFNNNTNTNNNKWDTVAITPGTVFMNQLKEKIHLYYNNPSQYNVNEIILSCSDKYGEGEHKIFEYIRSTKEKHLDEITVIYGLDADLIMLSINHLPIAKNLFLFRETPHFIKSINTELEPNESYLMDIQELAEIITQDMNININTNTNINTNRIYDYIFLCFFLGNDFMPHFPALNIRSGGVDKMIHAYKETVGKTNEVLYDGTKIYWKNVRKVVAFLADLEEDFIKTETKQRDKRSKYPPSKDELQRFDATPCYERSLEKYINPFSPNWQSRYYKTLFNMTIDDTRKKQICTNYLEGLEWTMKYYTVGCPDWKWCYNYNYPPLLADLIHYIPYFDTEFIKTVEPQPVTELTQLCYVLPKHSLSLLPIDLRKTLNEDWYDNDCTFVWAYCRYFWESHVNLPPIDINKLEHLVKEYKESNKINKSKKS
jgi:5'-3' exonuclease